MDKNKKHMLDLIVNMWYNELELGNGTSDFEGWCEDNIENKEQEVLLEKLKDHVNDITYILESFRTEYDELIMTDKTKFTVPAEWLHKLFVEWTYYDYRGTEYEKNKDYIDGIAKAWYENFEMESETVDDIFECAKSEGVIKDITTPIKQY